MTSWGGISRWNFCPKARLPGLLVVSMVLLLINGSHNPVTRGTPTVMLVDQTLFNIIIGVCGILGGWALSTMWGALKDLQRDDKALSDKVAAIEVLVAGQYTPREEFTTAMASLNTKLDLIVEKLNNKADRS